MQRTLSIALLVLSACDDAGDIGTGGGGGGGSSASVHPDAPGSGSTATSSSGSGAIPEEQPAPAEGPGVSDPQSRTLHNHRCGGIDWQRIHGWLLLPHAAPEIGPPDEMQRCIDRYAGWVTHEADAAEVSRASVYAALAASGQCDIDGDYDGGSLVPAALCTLVHPELGETACVAEMAAKKSFGIQTVVGALAATREAHERDLPLMAALLGSGAIDCGGEDRWRLDAPAGFVDRYVAAYNAYSARSSEPPSCKKRIVVTTALYTGMDDPGDEGVAAANGCWTYERVMKSNAEWKICNYDGTVHHENGVKWAYDDTNTNHDAALEKQRINACKAGVPGRGYIYMVNRGSGWPKRVTQGVDVHFAEIYSGQYAVADQFGIWKDAGKPGEPMVNFGEPSTSAATIETITKDVCKHVGDGGYFGLYVYPESLRAARMSAMVEALNACTRL